MAAEMKYDLLVFLLCGVFGWAGTPAVFQVVSRAIKYQVNTFTSGMADIYVDDIFGVSLKQSAQSDINLVCSFLRKLFNSDCVEDTKTETGRRVIVISYVIDLDSSLVSVSQKNYLRVLCGRSSIDFIKKVSVRTMQKFGSWVSRYGNICLFLKPLARTIHRSYVHQIDSPDICFPLSDEVRRTLQVFRAIFLSSMMDEATFTRPLSSIVPRSPSLIIEFDASLHGGGLLFFYMQGFCLGACRISLLSLIHLCVTFDIVVGEIIHIPAGEISSADHLSRGGMLSDIISNDQRLTADTRNLVVVNIEELLGLCNPSGCHASLHTLNHSDSLHTLI
jgi:hypothetical protein